MRSRREWRCRHRQRLREVFNRARNVDIYQKGGHPEVGASSIYVQLALDVDDLNEAVTVYSKVLNAEPAKLKEGYANFGPGTRFENWDTDEPSECGIGGIERMRLARDGIAARVADLNTRLRGWRALYRYVGGVRAHALSKPSPLPGRPPPRSRPHSVL